MIIHTSKLQELCQTILYGMSAESLNTISELVEIEIKNQDLCLKTTNKEYFVETHVPILESGELHATILAKQFLALMAKEDKESVELTTTDKYLLVKGSGSYKLPLIFEETEMKTLPLMELNNPTEKFNIAGGILNSIRNYNVAQLNMGVVSKPVQRLFYIDGQGCITFTTGASVNMFNTPLETKLLLNLKVVQLFKLFKNEEVRVSLENKELGGGMVQTVVRFENDFTSITVIVMMDPDQVNSVPANAIRARATKEYSNSCIVNVAQLTKTVERLNLFTNASFTSCNCMFDASGIHMSHGGNEESVECNSYQGDDYTCSFDIRDIKAVLSQFSCENIEIKFGDSQALVFIHDNMYSVVPEFKG